MRRRQKFSDLRPIAVAEVEAHVRADRQFDAHDPLVVNCDRQSAHDVQAHALRRLDQPRAFAMRAIEVNRPLERRAHALAGHLDDAELAHAQHLGFRAVVLQVVVQPLLELAAVALVAEVDEVADDHAAQVAQA